MPRTPHSEETKEKIRAAMLGRTFSAETIEKMRAAHTGKPSGKLGKILSDETKLKIKEARSMQVHPSLSLRGITFQQFTDAAQAGLKWCAGREHKDFIPVDQFTGKSSKCRSCTAASVARRRSRWTEEERQGSADYLSEYRVTQSESVRRNWLLKKYGVTHEWYLAKLEEQEGHCALCDAIVDTRKLAHWCLIDKRKYLLVDHSHETGIARGLLCAKCNTALHRVEYIQDWATKALAYLARYK